tara:strand:- start:528 stop:731 length:204 start_codon:yes stop_codon:yes gene_type:complete
MNLDGKITVRVINYFTNKAIPILTMHDSYITQHAYTGLLKEVMSDANSIELNGLEINIKLLRVTPQE